MMVSTKSRFGHYINNEEIIHIYRVLIDRFTNINCNYFNHLMRLKKVFRQNILLVYFNFLIFEFSNWKWKIHHNFTISPHCSNVWNQRCFIPLWSISVFHQTITLTSCTVCCYVGKIKDLLCLLYHYQDIYFDLDE